MHRLVEEFYLLVPKDISFSDFCKYHGLNENTAKTWRRKANPVSPQLRVFDDILNKMGYRLVIQKKTNHRSEGDE